MVATPAAITALDIDLRAIGAMLEDLPELARDWESESLDDRIISNHDWGQMMSFLVVLHRAYEAGEMSDAQRAAYRDLAGKLLAAGPQLRRLELVVRFPVPLETVTESQE